MIKLISQLRPSPAMAVALVALFVALGGTALAVIPAPNGAIPACYSTASGSLRVTTAGSCGSDSKSITLASQREVARLKARVYGCVPGRVNGYVAIRGTDPKFPTTYTTASPDVSHSYNCSGQAVQALRVGKGLYVVNFPGNPGTIAFGSAQECVEVSTVLCLYTDGVTVSVTKVTSGTYAGAFQVLVQDSVSGAKTNADIDVLVP
ncbi:MAG TPA: hypothetical protein VKT31_08675 [Solirubrobacteraceae bacterium]|nr:hypothetical protein [Solirubrobacteraceae bacterium]